MSCSAVGNAEPEGETVVEGDGVTDGAAEAEGGTGADAGDGAAGSIGVAGAVTDEGSAVLVFSADAGVATRAGAAMSDKARKTALSCWLRGPRVDPVIHIMFSLRYKAVLARVRLPESLVRLRPSQGRGSAAMPNWTGLP
jgi:hypothetical protein